MGERERQREGASGLPLCAAQRMLLPSHPPRPSLLPSHRAMFLSVTAAPFSHFCPTLHLKSSILADFIATSPPEQRSHLYAAFQDAPPPLTFSPSSYP